MRLFFSFSLMVVSTKSLPLPKSSLGNVLVCAFLMLYLNDCGASMKSIWLCTCTFGACHDAVLYGLCGCSLLARVSQWLLANSRSLCPVSLVCPVPNLLTVHGHVLVGVWSDLGVPVADDY
ncbi:hypothetical protein DPMN_176846 [Dreissena polymorpha]|uniref:Secreted protein n=1 Tax=Dreissena polymorpha TaxID=45954 RepID=A0A9D4IJM1_DREPO|nr:hypothetical protein DPMN_176846 [Dreissena polymorpha]